MKLSIWAILIIAVLAGCASSAQQVTPEEGRNVYAPSEAGNNLRDMVTEYLVHYIDLKAGLKVEKTESPEGGIELISSKDDEKVILTVKGVELSSSDILSQPVKAVLSLELRLIDKKGNITYRETMSGGHEALIDSFMKSGAKELIADLLVKEALKQFVNDPAFRKIMAKYKYGTLGSIVSIF